MCSNYSTVYVMGYMQWLMILYFRVDQYLLQNMGRLFRVSKDLRKAITILDVTIELYFPDYSICLAMFNILLVLKSDGLEWILTLSVCFSSFAIMWPYVAVIQKFLKTQWIISLKCKIMNYFISVLIVVVQYFVSL